LSEKVSDFCHDAQVKNYLDGVRSGLTAPRAWKVSIITLVIVAVVYLGLTQFMSHYPALKVLLRDMRPVAQELGYSTPMYTAWFVYIGVFGWWLGGLSTSFVGVLARRAGKIRVSLMMFGFGLFTLFLGADDLFQFHDGYPVRPGSPIHEIHIIALWVLIALVWGITFLPEILANRDLPIFIGAVVAFGWSLVTDQTGLRLELQPLLSEDASKMAAITLWAIWGLRLALRNARFEPEVPLKNG
jgi:hypothetical protein